MSHIAITLPVLDGKGPVNRNLTALIRSLPVVKKMDRIEKGRVKKNQSKPHKKITIIRLDRQEQGDTRLEAYRCRKIFPFLKLPAEIRNLIYDLSISVEGINKLFDVYYEMVKHTANIHSEDAPPITYYTPPFFRLCRQTYSESISFLCKRGLTTTHGLLDFDRITDFARPGLFRQLRSIEINDSGHSMFQTNIKHDSFVGHTKLIAQLAKILAKGHNLQSFTVSFNAPELALHTGYCWDAPHTPGRRCGYRDILRKALKALRSVRNVGNVTFTGNLPTDFCAELKARMESKPVSFLDLPVKARQLIYHYAADWSDISAQLHKMVDTGTNIIPRASRRPELSTPTVFLLNKQIYFEAHEILVKKPLEIVFPGLETGPVPHIFDFISAETLLLVRTLVISFEGTSFLSSIPRLVDILQWGGLESFSMSFTDQNKSLFSGAAQFYPDMQLHRQFRHLLRLNNLQYVHITGDLPSCYAQPLVDQMVAHYVRDIRMYQPQLCAERGDGFTAPIENYLGPQH